MRRQTLQTVFVGGAVALIVLFGIDIATSGIQRINGPLESSGITQQAEELPENEVAPAVRQMTVADAQHGRSEEDIRREYERKLQQELAKRLPGLPDLHSQSTVNQVADGTAGVLQSITSKGIRIVVSLFEKVTD